MIIRKGDLDENNFYKEDGLNTDEEITSEENLRTIKFKKSVVTSKRIYLSAGCGIEAGDGIVTLLYGITAKFIKCLRVCVGFNSKEVQTIEAEIKEGVVILGKLKECVEWYLYFLLKKWE